MQELSAMQNSGTPHRVILEFGRFVSGDNRHSAPECGFE